MSWWQAAVVFAQGKAAMFADGSGTYPAILSGDTSNFADLVGVAPMPLGPAPRRVKRIAIAKCEGVAQRSAAHAVSFEKEKQAGIYEVFFCVAYIIVNMLLSIRPVKGICGVRGSRTGAKGAIGHSFAEMARDAGQRHCGGGAFRVFFGESAAVAWRE